MGIHYHLQLPESSQLGSGKISIPIRHQWNDNNGYCGETSLIVTGMAQGQYMSQYTAREIANQFSQDAQANQILLNDDGSDSSLVSEFGLTTKLPLSSDFCNGEAFINWVRSEINAGYPVIIGVYENHSLFGSDAGKPDPEYDHIVVVTAIDETNISLHDHGLYTPDGSTAQDIFIIPISEFTKNRTFDPPGSHHLAPDSPADNTDFPYAISETGQCYGFAITGCANQTSYPVSVTADQSGEPDLVGDDPTNHYSPTTHLTPLISGLTPGDYYLYEFRSPGGPGTPPPIFPSFDLDQD
jgi:hypothetical protein